ncbi:MAG: hypothetical protein KF708_03425 [Pirellulales bacterium]|nr:hypothetical protein [Pirellulales bacterium]
MSDRTFERLEQTLAAEGTGPMLARLADELAVEKRFHELFDARLLAARHELGLPPILAGSLDELPEAERTQLEERYVEACREVGQRLLEEGLVREAWMYLRPTGDRATVAAALDRLAEADDLLERQQLEPLVEVALHEGVHPELGYRLVLDHYGTCNAITMLEGIVFERPRPQQQALVGILIRRVYRDLRANVLADLERRGIAAREEGSLVELLTGHDELLADDNYHLDTSHLHATVRFARLVEDRESIDLAWQLTEYGRRLSSLYQFAGEPPFEEAYVAHGRFFGAQLGHAVEEAVAYFRARAEEAPAEQRGTFPAEVYIVLLLRLGRREAALEASLVLLPPGLPTARFAPGALELARLARCYEPVLSSSRERSDLLSFAAALAQREHEARAPR